MAAETQGSRGRFKISVFLSYPKPCMREQAVFIDRMCAYLDSRGFAPRTLGVTDYDMDAPLKAIRRLMLESNGLITIALRRTYIETGSGNFRTNLAGLKSYRLDDTWLTSPWSHIEPAMAYQLGLPILILREKAVLEEGLLQKGVVGMYMPEFDLDGSIENYFDSPEWNDLIFKWEAQVRAVVDRKGLPPQLY
ncbi:hypothetical protein [Micromonospora sp. NPDC047527]|uniref:hypothetical protein n=1 Tax=unclassified Micromonospora TaxID=2617518 RepID=UPI0033D20A73